MLDRSAAPDRTDRLLMLALFGVAVVTAGVFRALATGPLWGDEAWRAYHVTLPGLELGLGSTYAPLAPAWLLVEKLAAGVLGSHGWALRLPSTVAWALLGPATFALGRRFIPRVPALLVTAALVINPAVIYYGLELKPYLVEALVTVLVVLAWALGRERRGAPRLAWYAAAGAVALLSVPAPFVLGPLVLLDLIQAAARWRAGPRALLRRAGPPLLAAGIALVNSVLFVLPQSSSYEYGYWPYLPDRPAAAVRAGAAQLSGYLAGSWTGSAVVRSDQPVPLPAAPALLLHLGSVGVAALVVLGAWQVRRRVAGQGVTVALVGVVAFTALASVAHRWPFGMIRANLFVLPLVYLLTGAGLGAIWLAWRAGRRLAAPTLVLALAVLGALAADGVLIAGELHRALPLHRYDDATGNLVAVAREQASPGTIVVGFQGGTGWTVLGEAWRFYMNAYDYPPPVATAPRIPAARTYFFIRRYPTERGLAMALAASPRATGVLVYTQARSQYKYPVLASKGFRREWLRSFRDGTGELSDWQLRT